MRPFLCLIGLSSVVGCASAPPPTEIDRFSILADNKPTADLAELKNLLAQDTLTEKEFLRLVEINNPQILSLRRDIEAAAARQLQAGLLPNPTLVAGIEEGPASPLRPGDGKYTVGLRYPLVVSGRIGASERAAEKERLMIESLVEAKRLELLRDARRSLHEYLYLKEVARLEEEVRGISAAFLEVVRQRREAKVVLELDLLKASVETATQEVETDSAQRELEKIEARLRAWTGASDFHLPRIRVELPLAYEIRAFKEYEVELAERHPSLRAAATSIELTDALLDLARREAYPDLGLSLAYGRSTDEGGREDIFEAGIEIPLPLFHRNQGRIAELEVLRRKALLEQDAAKLLLLAGLQEAYARLRQQIFRVAKVRDAILPDATKSVDQAMTLYKENKILSLEALDVQRTLARVRRTYLEARRDLGIAIAELDYSIGGRP